MISILLSFFSFSVRENRHQGKQKPAGKNAFFSKNYSRGFTFPVGFRVKRADKV
ncbi:MULTISPECIES: hypothetical protein [Pantoea]|jgi:hypothetical protein|uniref:Uncharacterized protein n=1 Tax=Pantoea brenneri TaxID=472694 RepID=A0A7Y6NAF3_9GAMM|nr:MULTISPECIES: hypothetical protein [Pantoea]MBS6032835.1 hypothetical protein [Pantoea sp.]MBZ6396088.1 hypothetical protein [Pantoea sp.]MBZ6439419.1 hypothetical protein [Pantoea sp.]MCQ5471449.1 hypothetical protein [Pantoea brenneri]MDH1087928.1 hypothetical protein [Pantoea brenneri]